MFIHEQLEKIVVPKNPSSLQPDFHEIINILHRILHIQEFIYIGLQMCQKTAINLPIIGANYRLKFDLWNLCMISRIQIYMHKGFCDSGYIVQCLRI